MTDGPSYAAQVDDDDAAVAASTAGALIEAEKTKAIQGIQAAQKAVDTVLNAGANLAVERAVGPNLKEMLPISAKGHFKIGFGQVLTVLGDVVGLFPIVGKAASAPLAASGAAVTASGQGFTAKQAAAMGAQTAGTGAAAGAIPGAGTVVAVSALINDCSKLCTPEPHVTKLQAVEMLEEAKAKAEEISATVEADPDFMRGPGAAGKVAALHARIASIEHYQDKYEGQILAGENRGDKGLLKYAAPSGSGAKVLKDKKGRAISSDTATAADLGIDEVSVVSAGSVGATWGAATPSASASAAAAAASAAGPARVVPEPRKGVSREFVAGTSDVGVLRRLLDGASDDERADIQARIQQLSLAAAVPKLKASPLAPPPPSGKGPRRAPQPPTAKVTIKKPDGSGDLTLTRAEWESRATRCEVSGTPDHLMAAKMIRKALSS